MRFRLVRRGPLFYTALALLGTMRMNGACAAETPPTSKPAIPQAADRKAAPAEIVKPIVPNRAELADVAFKKLDVTGKGYVTLEDVRGLEDFDKAFAAADTEHNGKLEFGQFKKAWAMYSGYK